MCKVREQRMKGVERSQGQEPRGGGNVTGRHVIGTWAGIKPNAGWLQGTCGTPYIRVQFQSLRGLEFSFYKYTEPLLIFLTITVLSQ